MPIGFHPYTLIQTNGPATAGTSNRMWQRTWEAKRWMPFTWAQIGMPGAGPGGIAFYGPYVVVDGPEGNLSMDATPHVECTLRMIVHPEANAE